MTQIWKLSSGKVVAVEGGVTQVLTPPTGVWYDFDKRRWVALIPGTEKDWMNVYFPIKQVGAVRALEQAASCREIAMSFLFNHKKTLLNRRLLPRIRRGYTVKEVNGLYAVYDPLSKCRRYFSEMKHAVAYNIQAIEDWAKYYAFDREKMVEIRTQLTLDFASIDGKQPEPLARASA